MIKKLGDALKTVQKDVRLKGDLIDELKRNQNQDKIEQNLLNFKAENLEKFADELSVLNNDLENENNS